MVTKLQFASDYIAAAHPAVLAAVTALADETNPGYGTDKHSAQAADSIRALIGKPAAEIVFLAGGTQTNMFWASTLAPWEGVLAARTGHIATHEAGAIEQTGHKVIELPEQDGKLCLAALRKWLDSFAADTNNPHMVHPGAVYISQPTEAGSVYTPTELTELREICDTHSIQLYVDGARLAYAGCDAAMLRLLGEVADAFYIGGTKCGTLLGEALVFPRQAPAKLVTRIKQHGALLAKGFVVGAQFAALFTGANPLYFQLGKQAVEFADRIRQAFAEAGIAAAYASTSNQIFVRLTPAQYAALNEKVEVSFWEADADSVTVRLATSWATSENDVAALLTVIHELTA